MSATRPEPGPQNSGESFIQIKAPNAELAQGNGEGQRKADRHGPLLQSLTSAEGIVTITIRAQGFGFIGYRA